MRCACRGQHAETSQRGEPLGMETIAAAPATRLPLWTVGNTCPPGAGGGGAVTPFIQSEAEQEEEEEGSVARLCKLAT